MSIDPALLERLPGLHTAPATLGPIAEQARRARVGDAITIRPCPPQSVPAHATIVRDGDTLTCDAWPPVSLWREGDRIVVAVAADDPSRGRYVAWLRSLVDPPPACTIAPCSADDGALHRLWCVAAARIAGPPQTGVEARHDLLGIRLAQLSLAMGADILSGPVEADRVLPLAGVPRPTESTRAGLHALVHNAGLRVLWDSPSP